MKKTLLAAAVAVAFSTRRLGRAHTQDIAYNYRMPTGFPGDVNRTHPASILPGLMNVTNPPRLYGDPVLIDGATNSYRGIVAGDAAASPAIVIDGVVCRPYPTQQTSGGLSAVIGGGAPDVKQPVDVISDGFIMVKVNVGNPVKGGPVFIWCTASTGNHVQGGFEAAASAGNTVPVANARFNGPVGADGVTELRINPANTI